MGTTKEKQLQTITIDDKSIEGYVEYHCHDIDGSQTILIKTERRESVENFLHDELVENNR